MADKLIERCKSCGMEKTYDTCANPYCDEPCPTCGVNDYQQMQAIAALTAENERLEAERVKLWNEKQEAVSSCHVAQAAADTMRAERDAIVKMLTDRMNAYDEYGDRDEMLALKYSIAAIERGDHKGDPANG